MDTLWKLRPGRIGELAELVAIDDDACALFADVGRGVDLPVGHDAFARAEQAAWAQSLAAGRVMLAATLDDVPLGFVSLGTVDGDGHVQQLSVRRRAMRRGIGAALMDYAIRVGGDALWLTTYSDIPWNRPYYERLGFSCVHERDCGADVARILEDERRALPAPEKRVAMCRRARR